MALAFASNLILVRLLLGADPSSSLLSNPSILSMPLERTPSCLHLELEFLPLPCSIHRHGDRLGLRLGLLTQLHDAGIDGLERLFIVDQRGHSGDVLFLDPDALATVSDLTIALTALLLGLFGLTLFAFLADLASSLFGRDDGISWVYHDAITENWTVSIFRSPKLSTMVRVRVACSPTVPPLRKKYRCLPRIWMAPICSVADDEVMFIVWMSAALSSQYL